MNSFLLFIWMTVLTGFFYPLSVTTIAQLTMSKKANGSLVFLNQNSVGSELIAQKFTEEIYFFPRPSFVDYHTLPAGGSHWGVTNILLKESVERKLVTLQKDAKLSSKPIPSELLFNSASGLDPHISPQCAHFQAYRVARLRHLSIEEVEKLIDQHIEKPLFGFLGPPIINVLKLNRALDLRRRS